VRQTKFDPSRLLKFAPALAALLGMAIPETAHAGSIQEGIPQGTAEACRNANDGHMDFELGADGVVIQSTIPGAEFTTTSGLNWQYGDIRTAGYNVRPYGEATYETNGNFFAWLGTTGDIGRITFVGGAASYVSVLVSTDSGLYLTAYDAAGNEVDDAGFAPSNVSTGTLTRMTVEGPNIAYVEIHDTGNFWIMDDLCTDAPSPCKRLEGYTSGPPDQRLDLVIVPADDYMGDLTKFKQHVVDHLENRLFAAAPLDTARDQFNIYYSEAEGTGLGFAACNDMDPSTACCASLPTDLRKQCPFADAFAVFHDTLGVQDCATGGLFATEGGDLRSFVHEAGHAVFSLNDEYDDAPGCDTSRANPVNTWSTDAACEAAATAHGVDPNQCYQFTTCEGGFFKLGDPTLASDALRNADPNFQFIMSDGNFFANGWGDAATWQIQTVLGDLAVRAELPMPEPSAEQALVLDLSFDASGVTVADANFLVSPAPNKHVGSTRFEARLRASDGTLLGAFGFEDPRVVKGERGPQSAAPLATADLQLVVPYYFNIAYAEIVDKLTQTVVASEDLTLFAFVTPGPTGFAGGPYVVNEGDAVTLDASASSSPNGGITRYEWDLTGDGRVDIDSAQPLASYIPLDDFNGLAYVRVENADGQSAVASSSFTVHNVAPFVDAGPDRQVLECERFQLQGSFSDPGVLDDHVVDWTFGDGTEFGDESLQVPYRYTKAGNYDITLHVTDDDGGVGNDVAHVSVVGQYINELPNGDVKFAITFSAVQQYVEVFARRNGVQHISGNIVNSKVNNGNGTYTYSRVVPASQYASGDAISARFYSYKPSSPGVFTPGPVEQVWLRTHYYKLGSDCGPLCHPYGKVLPNGDLQLSITLPRLQSYVEAFVRRNGVQIAAGNIVNNVVGNADGTFTYARVVPKNQLSAGNQITVRFYSYAPNQPAVFTPGPTASTWSSVFVVGQEETAACLLPP
jgi:hypothetical protein